MTEKPSSALGSNVTEMTVSELANRVRTTVEEAYGLIRVRGELGRVTQAPSGHLYADLKDDKSVLNLVMWKPRLAGLGFSPKEGMEIVAEGRLSIYAGRSAYQLIADVLHPAGDGVLLLQREERRRKLAAEGLFDRNRKQPIPTFPRVIGVVTSPAGAVIQDILHRIEDRFPCRVVLWPSRVQGREAVAEICAAIAGFNALPETGAAARPDVLIVARGGGSVEDLWAFNEESVVRAAAASRIPLISAVGHETDTTLMDYAADMRAPTPSAAAEMAVPVRGSLLRQLEQIAARNDRAIRHRLGEAAMRLRAASAGLPRTDALLQNARQRLDTASIRSEQAMRLVLERQTARLQTVSRVLDSVSPLGVLDRGYTIIRDEQGDLLGAASLVTPGQSLHIRFADGEIAARAGGEHPKRSAPVQQPRLL